MDFFTFVNFFLQNVIFFFFFCNTNVFFFYAISFSVFKVLIYNMHKHCNIYTHTQRQTFKLSISAEIQRRKVTMSQFKMMFVHNVYKHGTKTNYSPAFAYKFYLKQWHNNNKKNNNNKSNKKSIVLETLKRKLNGK